MAVNTSAINKSSAAGSAYADYLAAKNANTTPAASTQAVAASKPSYTLPSNNGVNMDAINNIVYYKQAYDNAVNAGKGTDSLNYIKNKANTVYGQLDADTAKQLQGMNYSQAADYYKTLKNGSNTSGINTTALTAQGAQEEQQIDPMYQMLQEYLSQMAAQNAAQRSSTLAQYNSLLGQYDTSMANEISALERDAQTSKESLADEQFQSYLNARQSMADKGLAGSGLASDQDTRLLMAGNKASKAIDNTLLTQKANTTSRYTSQMDSLRNQIAALQAENEASYSFPVYREGQ